MEERISDLENKNTEIIQLEERELRSKKGKKKKTLWELLNMKGKINWCTRKRREREDRLFKEKARTSQNLDKHTTKLIEKPITSMQKDLLQHTLHWKLLKINNKES